MSDLDPAWSPDGGRIAFARRRRYQEGDEVDPIRLCIMRATGGRATCVARWGAEPSWSPNGRLIAYSGLGKGSDLGNVWTVRPNGRGARRLVRGMSAGSPAWSPDGRFVAFVGARTRYLRDFSLWIVRRDGRGLRRVVRGGTWNRPVWSQDGRTLYFTSFVGRDIHSDLELFRVNRNGTGLVRLTRERGEDVDPAVAAK